MVQGDSFQTTVTPSASGATEVTASSGNHVTVKALAMSSSHQLQDSGQNAAIISESSMSFDYSFPIDDTNGVVVDDTDACQETTGVIGVQHK